MSMIQLSEPKTFAEMHAAHLARQAKFFRPTPVLTFPLVLPPKPQAPIEAWFDLFLDAAPIQAADRFAVSPDEWAMILELRAKDTLGRPTLSDIMLLVTETYGVSAIELRSKRRTQQLAKPRHIICYLAKTLTLKSLPEIGRFLGGRDHTTILSSVRRMTKLLLDDQGTLKAEIAGLEGQLAG